MQIEEIKTAVTALLDGVKYYGKKIENPVEFLENLIEGLDLVSTACEGVRQEEIDKAEDDGYILCRAHVLTIIKNKTAHPDRFAIYRAVESLGVE